MLVVHAKETRSQRTGRRPGTRLGLFRTVESRTDQRCREGEDAAAAVGNRSRSRRPIARIVAEGAERTSVSVPPSGERCRRRWVAVLKRTRLSVRVSNAGGAKPAAGEGGRPAQSSAASAAAADDQVLQVDTVGGEVSSTRSPRPVASMVVRARPPPLTADDRHVLGADQGRRSGPGLRPRPRESSGTGQAAAGSYRRPA